MTLRLEEFENRRNTRGLAVARSILLLALSAVPALASDGVLELNQTCAVETGCFSGDVAGFPVTITVPAGGSSFRLTSDLTVPNENTDGIVVNASDVGIDLNNFAILGPVRCTGFPTTCDITTGSGSGIERIANSNRGVSVKNGSITGMGFYGVLLGDQAEVMNLRVSSNRFNGIQVNFGSTVSNSTAYRNGNAGIQAAAGSTISRNSVHQNVGDGFLISFGSTVVGNTAYGNWGNGITALVGSTVQQDTARSNSAFGLNLDIDSAYRENTISGNVAGTVSSGVNMGANSCNGTASCP